MKHHRNFTISIDFDNTIVDESFPGIGNCCLLKDRSAGGYIWKYFKQEKIEIMNNVKLKIKKIC